MIDSACSPDELTAGAAHAYLSVAGWEALPHTAFIACERLSKRGEARRRSVPAPLRAGVGTIEPTWITRLGMRVGDGVCWRMRAGLAGEERKSPARICSYVVISSSSLMALEPHRSAAGVARVVSVHRLLEIARLVLSKQNNRLISFYMSSPPEQSQPRAQGRPDGIMYRMEPADIQRATALIRANRERLLSTPAPAPEPAPASALAAPVAVPSIPAPQPAAPVAEARLSAEVAFARSAASEPRAELSPTSELLFQLSGDFAPQGSSAKARGTSSSAQYPPKSGQRLYRRSWRPALVPVQSSARSKCCEAVRA